MKLLLTSEFDISFEKTKKIIQPYQGANVLFIPTAAYGEGFEPDYEAHIKPFETLGLKVKTFDIKNKSEDMLADALKDCDVVYGGPGNTFYFLEHAQKCNLKRQLELKFQQGGLYIGSSAGSILASPNIHFISLMDEPDKANLKDTKGFGFIDFLFLPHYDHEQMGRAAKEIMLSYKSDWPLYVFNDDQAVYVENKKYFFF
jgi:dipeptidase E